MIMVFNGIAKFFVSYLAILVVLALLPALLITEEVSLLNQTMAYLFNDKG